MCESARIAAVNPMRCMPSPPWTGNRWQNQDAPGSPVWTARQPLQMDISSSPTNRVLVLLFLQNSGNDLRDKPQCQQRFKQRDRPHF